MDWSKISIPFIIEKVVGNIIDTLKCEDIITLKHASVIGTIFDLDKLYKLNIINSLTYDGLKQKIYKFADYGLMEILFDLDPKKMVVQFSIPFLKEILYKRMLVELKNEIHLKVARLMGDSKFRYLPREIEKKLVNHHLIEEEKTILDHLVDTGDGKVEQILKEVNQRIKYLKETIDTVRDIDTRATDYGDLDIAKKLSIIDNGEDEEEYKFQERLKIKDDEDGQENKLISNRNMPIVKGGSIEKKSDKGITWEKRFVIITKTRFFYWYTYNDYKNNKQYLGMFELKNIYLIKKLSDFEFGQKTNLLQLKVSSFFKKEKLKDGRDYIFSFKSKSELNSWIITLNLLRAKSIYDEFRNTFGVINFPFNHEKVGKEDKRKIKRAFIMPDITNYNYKKKKSLKFYFMKTKIIDKLATDKDNKEKANEGNDGVGLFEEQKKAVEAECSVVLKERVECLYTVTLGYFLGVIQKNISLNISDNDNCPLIGVPNHLIQSIKNSKNFIRMIEEQEKSKKENKKINKSSIIISNNKVQIEGGTFIPGYEPVEKKVENDNMVENNKFLTNNISDIKDNNNNKINNNTNDNNLNKINDLQNNENNSNNMNNNSNRNIIICPNHESIITSSKKNSAKDETIIINNNLNNNRKSSHNVENHNLNRLKNSPETIDKSEDKVNETEKKERKKSSFASDREMDCKDKLKNLNIEINNKNLEEQIRQLLFQKKQ